MKLSQEIFENFLSTRLENMEPIGTTNVNICLPEWNQNCIRRKWALNRHVFVGVAFCSLCHAQRK